MKLLCVWVTGPVCDQIVLAHWRALPVKRDLMNAIFFYLSVGYRCGCITRAREHCRRNPLHSSATSEKGAGLAMGPAIKGAEEVVVLVMVMGKQELVGVCSQAPGMSRGYSCCLLCGPIFCYGSRAHTVVKYKKGCLFEE